MEDKDCYYYWTSFENIYLEDSYVLQIIESDDNLKFKVEIILTEKHELFTSPNPNEVYCYKIGFIEFKGIKQCHWISKFHKRYLDLNGDYDLGNIDAFYKEDDKYFIEGDWGSIVLSCDYLLIYWE